MVLASVARVVDLGSYSMCNGWTEGRYCDYWHMGGGLACQSGIVWLLALTVVIGGV